MWTPAACTRRCRGPLRPRHGYPRHGLPQPSWRGCGGGCSTRAAPASGLDQLLLPVALLAHTHCFVRVAAPVVAKFTAESNPTAPVADDASSSRSTS